mmetsp:Transcript_31168/g.57462  ORF Transcript_31168/g.57462 Transcript_31168/m.57462 type:complete len:176 (-) Transcript_31168:152-679(-)
MVATPPPDAAVPSPGANGLLLDLQPAPFAAFWAVSPDPLRVPGKRPLEPVLLVVWVRLAGLDFGDAPSCSDAAFAWAPGTDARLGGANLAAADAFEGTVFRRGPAPPPAAAAAFGAGRTLDEATGALAGFAFSLVHAFEMAAGREDAPPPELRLTRLPEDSDLLGLGRAATSPSP